VYQNSHQLCNEVTKKQKETEKRNRGERGARRDGMKKETKNMHEKHV